MIIYLIWLGICELYVRTLTAIEDLTSLSMEKLTVWKNRVYYVLCCICYVGAGWEDDD